MISVIIPTYHDWPRLSKCLDALNSQNYPKSNFEILVVNNDPKDQTPNDFIVPENCKILSESKPGSYAARNHAIKVAKGDIFAFTDSDCIPDKDWLKNGVDALKNNNVSRIGGAVEVFAGETPNIAEVYDLIFAFPQQGYVEDMGWAVTANLFVTKELIDAVGDFNTNLKSGGDYEWGIRALEKNYSIMYSKATLVKHPARNSLKELLKKAKRVRIGIEDKNFDEGRLEDNPKFLRKLYIIFRPRYYELETIKSKVDELGLDKKYIKKILWLRNLVLGYGDYHAFKRRKELNIK